MTVESLDIEDGKDSKSNAAHKRKTQILMAIIAVLLILSITFISLYASAKSSDDDDATNAGNKGAKTPPKVATTTIKTITTDVSQKCETQECHDAANRMGKLMDMAADPCVDFSEFACGKFYKETVIPDDRVRIGSYDFARNETQKLHEELLTGPKLTNSSFETKMRRLYNACMDEDAIEQRGLADYTNKSKEDWPTLNPGWKNSSFDLQSVINKYFGMFHPILFGVDTDVDNSVEPPVRSLYIGGPGLFLDKPTLLRERNSTKVMALETYYKEFSMALGANQQQADVDAKDMVNMFRELAKLKLDPVDRRNTTKTNNPATLGEMDAKYPYLNWTEAMQSMFDIETKKIEPSQKITIRNMEYIEKVGVLLNRTDDRLIQNMFGFIHAIRLVSGVTKRMREIDLNFDKAVNGVEKEKPRSEQCVRVVNSIYKYGMAKLVSNVKFSQNTKQFMDRMIENLKKSFQNSFESLDWIEATTRKTALEKLMKMKAKIGIPDSNFTDMDIDNMYKEYNITGDYNIDRLQNRDAARKESWSELGQKIKKWKWRTPITTVNAYNIPNLNEIAFPLGIFQPPFFDQDNPGYLNYGAIGSIIGHEIGHGFDSSGRNYDEIGNVTDWWTSEDAKKYEEKTKCFVDQYSRFNVTIGNTTYPVKGDLTKTENVPDTVGVTNSYKAYKMYQKTKGTNELPLPNLNLNVDQLFFLSYAQVRCAKSKPESIKTRLGSGVHSLGKLRILGAFQNIPQFAKAYSCKVGDYMNPKEKCTLW